MHSETALVFISWTRNSNTHMWKGQLVSMLDKSQRSSQAAGSPLDPERNQRHCDGLAINLAPLSDGLHSIGGHATAAPAPLHGTALWLNQSHRALGFEEILQAEGLGFCPGRYHENFSSPKTSSFNGTRTCRFQSLTSIMLALLPTQGFFCQP